MAEIKSNKKEKTFKDVLGNIGKLGDEVFLMGSGQHGKPEKRIVIAITEKMVYMVTPKAFSSKNSTHQFEPDSYLNGYEKRYHNNVVINGKIGKFGVGRHLWDEVKYIVRIRELEAKGAQ